MMKAFFAAVFLLSGITVQAAQPSIYTKGGLALSGYDPVAYFTDSKPAKGLPNLEIEWNGVRWRFASAEHRDASQVEPSRYASHRRFSRSRNVPSTDVRTAG